MPAWWMQCLTAIMALAATIGVAAAQPKVEAYSMDITFHPSRDSLSGRCRVTLSSDLAHTRPLRFYLHGELGVDSITSASGKVDFTEEPVFYDHDYSLIADQVVIDTGRPFSDTVLTVYYQGYFHPSSARSQSDYMRIDSSGVLLRSYGYSLWFPIFLESGDESYAVNFDTVRISTPLEFHSVFVGSLSSVETRNGWRISTWSARQINLFESQCTAQRYEVTERGPYHLYHYADSISRRMSTPIINFLQRIEAEYSRRYRRSAQAQDYFVLEMPRYGDISSGNVTGVSSDIWQGFSENQNPQRGLAHEMVHPFVRVPVPTGDSLAALVIEGFPSYFHLPVLNDLYGNGWLESYMKWVEKSYLEKRRTGSDYRGRPLPQAKPITEISESEIGVYKDNYILDDRALLFLYYLQRDMGDVRFSEFARKLLNREQITLAEFRNLIHSYLPMKDAEIISWLSTSDFPESFRISP